MGLRLALFAVVAIVIAVLVRVALEHRRSGTLPEGVLKESLTWVIALAFFGLAAVPTLLADASSDDPPSATPETVMPVPNTDVVTPTPTTATTPATTPTTTTPVPPSPGATPPATSGAGAAGGCA